MLMPNAALVSVVIPAKRSAERESTRRRYVELGAGFPLPRPALGNDTPKRARQRQGRDRQMDRRQFFGDSVAGTLIRLVLLSVVVGIVFSVLGITPINLIERLQHLVRNIMNLGFDAVGWAVQYFLLGAVIVFPIWFLVRLLSNRRNPNT
jgi:hypothetical protein